MRVRRRPLLSALALAISLIAVAPANAQDYWQCAHFARLFSGIEIFGDARTWWTKARGHYDTGAAPKAGSVLCFKPNSKMKLGHVAVVSQVLTDRIIQVTHANWSIIEGDRGQVEQNVTVIDTSPKGDWTEVKVWYDPAGDLGSTTYKTWGFIYPDAHASALAAVNSKLILAQTVVKDAALSMAKTAAAPLTQFGDDASDVISKLLQTARNQTTADPTVGVF